MDGKVVEERISCNAMKLVWQATNVSNISND